VEWVFHRGPSIKRIDGQRRLTRLKPLPIDDEFLLMQLAVGAVGGPQQSTRSGPD
jgi:hypothetical protein